MILKNFFILILFLVIVENSLASSSKISIQKALMITANQQVLSQQLAKVYLALCNNPKNVVFYRERTIALRDFEEQLFQLSLLVPNDDIKLQIQKVRSIWKRYKAVVDWTIKRDAAYQVLTIAKILLEACEVLHNYYQAFQYEIEQQDFRVGRINQYIKQNNRELVLIQQVLLYYLAEKQGIDSPNSLYELQKVEKAFVRGIDIMEKAEHATGFIDERMARIKASWKTIQEHLSSISSNNKCWEILLEEEAQIANSLKDLILIYNELNQIFSIDHALKLAVDQCIRSQKIAQNYVVLPIDSTVEHSEQLLQDIETFEHHLSTMRQTALDQNIEVAVIAAQEIWSKYKELLLKIKERDSIAFSAVEVQSQKLLESCEGIIGKINDYATKYTAEHKTYKDLHALIYLK